MQVFLKKVSGAVVGMVISAISGILFVASIIGYSTTPEDAAALVEKLPRWLAWLLSTGWQIPVVLMVLMTLYVFWAFWPDRSLERELRAAVAKLKDENVKAWEFSADHAAFKHEVRETLARIELSQRAIESRLSGLEDIEQKAVEFSCKAAEAVSENLLPELVAKAKTEIAETLQMQISSEMNALQGQLARLDILEHQVKRMPREPM